MSFRTPIDCSTSSLEGLEDIVSDEIASAFTSIIDQIANIEEYIDDSGIEQIIDDSLVALQDIVSLGDSYSAITDIDQLPDFFGIDKEDSQENDEIRIFESTDLVMSNGIFFKKPSLDNPDILDNIKILRDMYLANGKDLNKVISDYASTNDSSYKFRLSFRKILPVNGRRISISEIRAIAGNTITKNDYVELSDYTVIVINKIPLLNVDIAKKELPIRYSLLPEMVTSSIFHKSSPKNTTSAINRWNQLGYSDELPYILDGQDPNTDYQFLNDKLTNVKFRNNSLINAIKLYIEKYNSVSSSVIRDSLNRLITDLDVSTTDLISSFLFSVHQIKEFDTVSKLRERMTDEEIDYLLSNQKYVKGIDFNFDELEISSMLQSLGSTSGDTTISTSVLNNTQSLVELNFNIAILILSDILSIKDINDLSIANLKKMLELCESISSKTFFERKPESSPLSGFPSLTSPSVIVMQRINFKRNFKLKLSLGVVDEALAKLQALYSEVIAKTLGALFKILAKLAEKAISLIDTIRNKILSKIMPLKRKLDALISKYLTLIGSGEFDSSILKCAVNFNIGLDTDIFGYLEHLIEQLSQVLTNLISILTAMLVEAIQKILCPIISMFDQFMGSANSYLPSFCSFNSPVLLPPEVINALNKLKYVASLQQDLFNTFNGDLIRGRAIVETAPDKLNSFVDGAGCISKPASNMMSSSLINVSKNVSAPKVMF